MQLGFKEMCLLVAAIGVSTVVHGSMVEVREADVGGIESLREACDRRAIAWSTSTPMVILT
jgi:hypothetical protein